MYGTENNVTLCVVFESIKLLQLTWVYLCFVPDGYNLQVKSMESLDFAQTATN